jgi:hypothetical protein
MAHLWIGAVLAASFLCALFAAAAVAHPASGMVVSAQGEVFFNLYGSGRVQDRQPRPA